MSSIIDLFNRRTERLAAARLGETAIDAARRSMLTRAAALGAGAVGTATALMAPTSAKAQTIGDADILTFALNLEYLEAEFYALATTGKGLTDDLTGPDGGSTTTRGTTTGGSLVPFTTTLGKQYAGEIAADERNHVAFLRAALKGAGAPVVARPNLNMTTSFQTLFNAAGLGANFNPFASESNFLLGAFVFEDVGVTAYKGASPLITNKTYLEVAAGILAVEAYHAGLIRTVLYARGANVSSQDVNDLRYAAGKISDVRDSVDGTSDDDQGIAPGSDPNYADTDTSNIVPLDANGIAYSRNTNQVLNIVYLNAGKTYPLSAGGFFPNGLNGTIKTSTNAN